MSYVDVSETSLTVTTDNSRRATEINSHSEICIEDDTESLHDEIDESKMIGINKGTLSKSND